MNNNQILTLHENGFTAEQIAGSFQPPLELDAVKVVIASVQKKKGSLEERYGDLQHLVMRTYMDVCENSENDSARVRAAELLDTKLEKVNSGGLDYNLLADHLRRAEQRVIDIESQEVAPHLLTT